MSLLPNWDAFTHKRPTSSADAEGNATTGVTTIGTGSGVWGTASTREQQIAAQRGDRVDSFFSTGYDGFRNGDILVTRGHNWTVVGVKDVRLHNRIALRDTDRRPVNA